MTKDQLDQALADAEDAGYISGELVRAVGEGATAYVGYRLGAETVAFPKEAAAWWSKFFNAAMDAVVEREPAEDDVVTEPKPPRGERRCPVCLGVGNITDHLDRSVRTCVRCTGTGFVTLALTGQRPRKGRVQYDSGKVRCPDCFNADPSLDGPTDENGHCVRCGETYVVTE